MLCQIGANGSVMLARIENSRSSSGDVMEASVALAGWADVSISAFDFTLCSILEAASAGSLSVVFGQINERQCLIVR